MIIIYLLCILHLVWGEDQCCPIKEVTVGSSIERYNFKEIRPDIADQRCKDGSVYTKEIDGLDYCFGSDGDFPVVCKAEDPVKHYGLVVTGGDNPSRTNVSEQISSMGVCVSPTTNIPDLPEAIAGAKSAWLENEKALMFCGGSKTFTGKMSQKPDGWGALNTCWRLTPGSTSWGPSDNMIYKRSWFSLNNVNKGTIGAVAAGGSGYGGDNILKSIEHFHHGVWKKLLDQTHMEIKLDKKVYGHCAVHFSDVNYSYLMIIGGSHDGENFDAATKSVTIINLNLGHNQQVTHVGELPELWAPACVKKGQYIYVTGGGNNGKAFRDVYRGKANGKFVKIGTGLGAERSGHTMGVTSDGPEGQLFVAGGYDPRKPVGSQYLKEIETSTDDGYTWKKLETTLTVGGEYAAMASVPAFTFKCKGKN